jgi:hypothetical protein
LKENSAAIRPTGFARPLDRAPSLPDLDRAMRGPTGLGPPSPPGALARPPAMRCPVHSSRRRTSRPQLCPNPPAPAIPSPIPRAFAQVGGRLWEPPRSAFILSSEAPVNASVVSSSQLWRNSQNVLSKVFIDTPHTPTAPQRGAFATYCPSRANMRSVASPIGLAFREVGRPIVSLNTNPCGHCHMRPRAGCR